MPLGSQSLLGVGGAVVFEGKLWHGAHYFAGEAGQSVRTLFQRVMERQWRNKKETDDEEIKVRPSVIC